LPSEQIAETSHTHPASLKNVVWRHLRLSARALGSLLLGGIAVLGAIFAFRQGLLPLIDTIFRPGPEGLSALRRAGILLAAIAGYFAYTRWFEKREATELRLRPVPVVLGGASGTILVAFPITALFVFGAYDVVDFRIPSSALLGAAVVIVIAATLEELVYRCLLFRVLERALGTWVALAVQSVIFAVVHLGNVERGGVADVATMLVSVTLLGLLWTGVFILTRNLWVVAAHHAAWNFTILLSGVPLSGIEDWRAVAPLETRYAGPDWLTGGIFGPESSLLVIVLVTITVVLLYRTALRNGAFLKPAHV
jgi:uncharacterized protein